MGELYEIAANFRNASDEQVARLKTALQKTYHNEIGDMNIKIFCRKEWALGTFIDIYVLDVSKQKVTHHFNIDRDDVIGLPIGEPVSL